MVVTVRTEGFRELNEALGELPRATEGRVLRSAGRKAMQPMADLASRLAPDDSTTPPIDLHTSIVLSTQVRRGRGNARAIERDTRANIYMGPRFDLDRYVKAMVMEFGSFKDRPQPYMRPAFDQDAAQVIERLKPLLRAEIDKAVARAARRAARLAVR